MVNGRIRYSYGPYSRTIYRNLYEKTGPAYNLCVLTSLTIIGFIISMQLQLVEYVSVCMKLC